MWKIIGQVGGHNTTRFQANGQNECPPTDGWFYIPTNATNPTLTDMTITEVKSKDDSFDNGQSYKIAYPSVSPKIEKQMKIS